MVRGRKPADANAEITQVTEAPPAKPKVAFYWCASCGGCEEAVVDLAEKILDVVAAVDIVLWPVALDFKKKHVEAMPDGSIAVAFVNGGVRLSEQEEWVRLLRRKAGLLVAFGACAHRGGVPGLANLASRAEVFGTVCKTVETLARPGAVTFAEHVEQDGNALELPSFYDRVRTVDQVVEVDYYLPGCPPTPELLGDAVAAILSGQLPPKGAVLSPNVAMCEACPRVDSKPEKMTVSAWKRVGTSTPDLTTCLLAQGYVCMGPATRQGCGEGCIRANMPCRGCFGPLDGVPDIGAAFIAALGTLVEYSDDEQVRALMGTFPDPVGTLYRYGLPAALLGGKVSGGKS